MSFLSSTFTAITATATIRVRWFFTFSQIIILIETFPRVTHTRWCIWFFCSQMMFRSPTDFDKMWYFYQWKLAERSKSYFVYHFSQISQNLFENHLALMVSNCHVCHHGRVNKENDIFYKSFASATTSEGTLLAPAWPDNFGKLVCQEINCTIMLYNYCMQ